MPFMPIILVTAKADTKDVVAGLEAGADEYLTKPVDQTALVARVKSVLRIKELHDKVRRRPPISPPGTARSRSASQQQFAEIERIGRLKRFLSPQVAELILSSGDDTVLESHRRDVTVVFCDLRGFTAFAETAEPEEVMGGAARVSRRARRADPQVRRHARALRRRRRDDPVQRSAAVPRSEPARGAHGGRDARRGRRARRRTGARPATSSASASASRTAMPRSAASASRAGSTIRRSARWSISRRGCAPRPRTARS